MGNRKVTIPKGATLNKSAKEVKEQSTKGKRFPIHVFPEDIQQIIHETNTCLNFPKDYMAASVLTAVSVAIGNTYRVQIKSGWNESAVLYIAIVGNPGVSKTHPLKWALRPVRFQDNKNFRNYKNELRKYEDIMAMSKKERENEGYPKNPKRPELKQKLLNDFTPEALADVHSVNPNGLCVIVDELASWFKNFNRYNQGSEQEFWLSNWSGQALKINRKTSEPMNIPMPFISVSGTIQPAVLNALADNRKENGFIDRILFVMPEGIKKDPWSDTELEPRVQEKWDNIINRLLENEAYINDEGVLNSKVITFSADARKRIFEWQREFTNESNNTEGATIKGINAKIEVYAIRFCLILQILKYACRDTEEITIDLNTVNGAIELAAYFQYTATKVHDILNNDDPLQKETTEVKQVYEKLPERFNTSQGVNVAESVGMPERTFKRLLQKKNLFEREKHGTYLKLL